MNQLTKQNSPEVTVNMSTGIASMSRAGLAKRLNVPVTTLKTYLTSRGLNQLNQPLDEDSVYSTVAYFALTAQTPTPEAKALLLILGKAGTKAYLYHEAGYTVSASPVRPMALPIDYVSALRALADVTEQKILLLEENTEKRIKTDSSEYYFTVRKVRNLNQGTKIDGRVLVKKSEEMEVTVKQVFDLYEQQVNAYHADVWLESYPDIILP